MTRDSTPFLDASDPSKALRLAVTSWRAELRPANDAEGALTLQKMRMAIDTLRPGMMSMPVIILSVAAFNLFWTAWPVCLGWAVTALVTWGIGWPPLIAVLNRDIAPRDVARTILALSLRMIGFVVVYGAQGFLFFHAGDATNNFCIVLILVGSSVSAAMTAGWLPMSLLQAGYYLGVVEALLLAQGSATHLALAGLVLFFALFLFGMVVSMHAYSALVLTLAGHKDELIAQLQYSNRTKSEFLANMSHELRTPMNAILGFSEIIKDELMGPNGKPTYRSYAADIHASGVHLLGLINAVLDLSKIEAGRQELNEADIDLSAVVEDAMRIIRQRADEKGVILVNALPPGVRVHADPSALRQVALNLASNAIKFTPAGGTVSVSVSLRDGVFGVLVRDTGCGISPADMDKIFETFGQGAHDVATTEKGTGLGLPIARGLMRAHGGDITIRSTPGKGTTVRVTLPPERILDWPGARSAAA